MKEEANKVNKNKISFAPRKLARQIAKANMKKAGLRKVNRGMRYYKWREWVFKS